MLPYLVSSYFPLSLPGLPARCWNEPSYLLPPRSDGVLPVPVVRNDNAMIPRRPFEDDPGAVDSGVGLSGRESRGVSSAGVGEAVLSAL